MVAANAATASATATFATKVTELERLALDTQTAVEVDVAALGNYKYITTTGAANTLTIKNLDTSGTGGTPGDQCHHRVGRNRRYLNGSSGGATGGDALNLAQIVRLRFARPSLLALSPLQTSKPSKLRSTMRMYDERSCSSDRYRHAHGRCTADANRVRQPKPEGDLHFWYRIDLC